MATPPTAFKMQVRFWLPDGTVVEHQPTRNTEVTESMDMGPSPAGDTRFVPTTKAMAWKPRDVTVHGVHPIRHAPGYMTDEEREIAALRAEVEELRKALEQCEQSPFG